MIDINTLLQLNIELEGLLRVLVDRDNIHARTLLAEKFEQYSDALRQYLAESEPAQPQTEQAAEEVCEQGAAENQTIDETEVATSAGEEEETEEAEVEITSVTEEPEPAEEQIEPADEDHATANMKLLSAFTINDKFRFRRELFNGDIEDFADTLDLLARMPSYDEAVDYLTNDLLWDTRNPAVEEFFEILKKNMP